MPFTARCDAAFMQIDDAFCDRQSEPVPGYRAVVGTVFPPEAVEDMVAVFRRDAFTCIEYRQDPPVCMRFQLQADQTVLAGILERIAEQDDRQLLDHLFLSVIGDVFRDIRFQGATCFEHCAFKRQDHAQ